MRSEFQDVFKEHRQEGKSYSAEYKLGALWAWDYQQSKVDELQKRLGELIKHLDGMGEKSWAVWESSAEMYEQGRADAYWAVKDLLEQALNGDQYEENRKKAEDAISNGASLTKHRIEL